MQPERNVLSRKRRRGTLIGNLSKRVKYLLSDCPCKIENQTSTWLSQDALVGVK